MLLRVAPIALLVLACAASAAASPADHVRQADAKALVLQVGDLPHGFGVEQGHYVTNAQLAETSSTKKDYGKLGRLTGYYTAYTTIGLGGLTAVSSFASISRSARSAMLFAVR